MGKGIRVVTLAVACLVALAIIGENSEGARLGGAQSRAPALYIGPTGSDASCTRGSRAPCATMTRAFDLARCGDTVEIAGGRYPDQQVWGVPHLERCSTPVTFRPAAGARAVFPNIYLDGPDFDSAPSNIAIVGVVVERRIEVIGASHDIRLEQIDGGSFTVRGPHRVQILDSDWGPCPSSGPSGCSGQQTFVDSNRTESQQTSQVLVRGNTFHDFDIITDGDHFECLFVTGGSSITIERNRFSDCETYDLLLAPRDWANFERLVVRQNWFGRTCCFGGLSAPPGTERSSAIAIIASPGSGGLRNATITANSFVVGQTMVIEEGRVAAGVRATRNLFGATTCVPGVAYERNMFPRRTCGPRDRSSTYGYDHSGYRLRLRPAREPGGARRVRRRGPRRLVELGRADLTPWSDRPPRGGWTTTTLRTMLGDQLYLGSQVGAPGSHPALVSPAVWRRVGRQLARG